MLAALRTRAIYFTPLMRWGLLAEPFPAAQCPEDIWVGDAQQGKQLVSRHFDLAGQNLTLARPVDWWMGAKHPGWQTALHAFAWIRDIYAFNQTIISASHARDFVRDWIKQEKHQPSVAYAPEITGQRVSSWLLYYHFISSGARPEFRQRFVRSIMQQLFSLQSDLERGVEEAEFHSVKALLIASFCLPNTECLYNTGIQSLLRLIETRLVGKGGHISRNPEQLVKALEALLEIRGALWKCRQERLSELESVIDWAIPLLGYLRHGDGGLPCFHGSGEGNAQHIDRLIMQAGTDRPPLEQAPESGYARLEKRHLCVLADVSPARGSGAYISAMSMEVSHGSDRIIVNCGPYEQSDAQWRKALRATAAHSTLSADDRNAWPNATAPKLEYSLSHDNGERILSAIHDGYRERPGLVHHRKLVINSAGHKLMGTDSVTPQEYFNAGEPHALDLRFHLHPSVSVQPEGSGFALITQSGQHWRFHTTARNGAKLEESIYTGQGLPFKPSRQIVIQYRFQEQELAVEWTLEKIT